MKRTHVLRLCELEGPGVRGARQSLTGSDRSTIFKKTGGLCHVCGGSAGKSWQADHIRPHRLGGEHSIDNYLPICRVCNTLRRSHSPKVQQLIIRLGTYARSEIRKQSEVGEQLLVILQRRLGRNKSSRAGAKKSTG